MAEIGNFFVSIGSKLDSAGFKNATQQIRKVGVAAAAMGATMTIVGLKVARAAGIQEQAEFTLAEAMKVAGTFTKEAHKHNLEYAASLQKMTSFGDEAIIGVQKMLTNFGIEKEAMDGLTKATLDLAAAKGMDLKAAGDLVAKSVGSTTNALTRYGIEVTGAVGSTERAQTAVENITKIFGGAASAMADTYLGRIEQLKNRWGDFVETVGFRVIPIIEQIMSKIFTAIESVDKWVKENHNLIDTMVKLGSVLTLVLSGISPLLIAVPTLTTAIVFAIGKVKLLWAAMAAHPMIAVTAAIAGATLALGKFIEKRIDASTAAINLNNTTKDLIKTHENELKALEKIILKADVGSEKWTNAIANQQRLLKTVAFLQKKLAREEEARKKNDTVVLTEEMAKQKEIRTIANEEDRERAVLMDEFMAKMRKKQKEEEQAARIENLEKIDNFVGQMTSTFSAFTDLRGVQIRNNLSDDINASTQNYENRKAWINANIKDEQERNKQLDDLEKGHSATITNLKQKAEEAERKARRRMKPLLIAEAIANTALGATKAYGQGGMFGFVTAALITAAGMAKVAMIKAQKFAKGALIKTPTLATFAEEGPEVALPLNNPATIDALAGALQAAGAGMGGNIYVTVPPITTRGEAARLGDVIGNAIMRKVKRNRRL